MHIGILIQGILFTIIGVYLTVVLFRSYKRGRTFRISFINRGYVFRKEEPKKFFFNLIIYLATAMFFSVVGVAGLLYYFVFL